MVSFFCAIFFKNINKMTIRLKCTIQDSYGIKEREQLNSILEHVVIIRFSVDLNRNEFTKNIGNLLKEERLEYRFELFEKYCFVALSNQSVCDFKVIILIDKNLPTKYVNKLNNIIKNEKNFCIHYWNKTDKLESNSWLIKYIDTSKKFLCTTRIDDDDIIHYKANELFKTCLYKKIKNFEKRNIFHLSSGIYIHIEKDEKIYPIVCTNKSLAVFMSLVTPMNNDEYNIYYYSHDIIQQYPEINQHHIMCPNGSLFGVTNHFWENDTRYKRFAKHKKETCTLEEIYEKFK